MQQCKRDYALTKQRSHTESGYETRSGQAAKGRKGQSPATPYAPEQRPISHEFGETMESSGPRSKLFSNGLYPDTWTGAISNFDIAWPLWFEYVTVAHPMLDPTKQHLKEIIFHATYCVNFPSPSSFKMISSLQAIPWFDWKVVVGSLFVILPCLTYLTTTASSISAMHSKEVGRTPPSVPYWFPYLGSLIPFLRNSAKFTIEVK